MKKPGSPEFDDDKNNSKIAKELMESITTSEDFKHTTSDDGCLAETLQNASSQNENSTQASSHEKETSEEKPSTFENDEAVKVISREELERDLAVLEEILRRMSAYKEGGLGLLNNPSIDIENLCCIDIAVWRIAQVASDLTKASACINGAIGGVISAIVAASGPLDKSS